MEVIPVGELHDFLSLADENPPPWSQDIPDMRNCPEMMCSPFITRILREKGMAVCMDRITGHNDGPGRGMSWRGLLENDGCYSPGEPIACMSEDGVDLVVTDGLYSVCRARFQYYREKRLPVLSDVHLTTLTCHHVRDVYRLLSALNDAERDIRIRNKGASLRSWWQRFAGRVQG